MTAFMATSTSSGVGWVGSATIDGSTAMRAKLVGPAGPVGLMGVDRGESENELSLFEHESGGSDGPFLIYDDR